MDKELTMAQGKHYARSSAFGRSPKWELWKRSRGGDRQLATNMSEATARRVAKLMNEDEAVFDKRITEQMNDYNAVESHRPQPLMEVLRDKDYWADL